MPEFGANLQKQVIWEWKPYYLNYDRLKGWINALESSDSDKAVKMFYDELELSVERVHQFYTAKESDIKAEVYAAQRKGYSPKSCESAEDTNTAAHLLDELAKLQLFAEQNQEGFRKIAKKFDKNAKSLASKNHDNSTSPLQMPSLQERVVELVAKFPFAAAEQQLQPWVDTVRAMQEGLRVSVPSFAAHRRPSRVMEFARVSLGEPLLVAPEQGRSASQFRRKASKLLKENIWLLVQSVVIYGLARYNPSSELTATSYLVIWVTAIVLTFLVRQYPADMVLMAATLFLAVCGVLTQRDAWAAFSNDVVLSVAGLGVVAHGVEKTGVIDIIFGRVLGKPRSLPVAMLRLFMPAVILNVCVSNTCVMSCLMTVIDKWSADIGYSKAFFLMPLSYVLLVSGTFATFTTSTNLVAQGQLLAAGFEGFDTFALSGIATASTVVEILYLLVIAPIILRRFSATSKVEGATSHGSVSSRRHQNRYDVRVQIIGRALAGETLQSSGILAKLCGIQDVCACEHYGKVHDCISEDFTIALDDILWIRTNLDSVASLFHTAGIAFLALDLSDDVATFDPRSRNLVEAVLDTSSPLVGHQVGHARKYQPEYDCPIVAFRAFNSLQGADCSSVDGPSLADLGATPERRLQGGDHIILNTPPSFYNTFKDSQDFVVLRKVAAGDPDDHGESTDQRKALYAGCMLAMLVVLVSTSTLQLLEAVFACLAGLILTGCTTMDACIRAVKLRTVLVIVGAFGLGKAIGQQGVAQVLANILIFLLGPFGRRGMLIAVFGATVLLGIIFHGTAVVVLMFPICNSVSQSMGIPIHQMIAVLCLSVSCQMLSPISYQTNLMAYSTGGYKFADFTKVGLGLVFCIAVVAIPMCEYTFPS